MMRLPGAIALLTFVSLAGALPNRNVTIAVPEGFSNHGKEDLFCVPTHWYQILTFFAVNYVAHAATVKSRPGQHYHHTIRDFLLALAFPFSGVLRAIETLSRGSWPSEKNLIKAARAGAFCVVARDQDWQETPLVRKAIAKTLKEIGPIIRDQERRRVAQHADEYVQSSFYFHDNTSERHVSEDIALEYLQPQAETYVDTTTNNHGRYNPQRRNSFDKVVFSNDVRQFQPLMEDSNCPKPRHNSFLGIKWIVERGSRSYRRIHGVCRLPKGYSLAWLPSNAKVVSAVSGNSRDVTICSSYNIPKAIIAMVQTVYGSITLYRARGDQIQRYGYVAFGLTVIPYTFMSIVNLCVNILVPDYPTLYIVRSLESDEALALGGQIDGAIGRVSQDDHERQQSGGSSPNLFVPDDVGSKSTPEKPLVHEEGLNYRGLSAQYREVAYITPLAQLRDASFPPFEKNGRERWSIRRQSIVTPIVAHIIGGIPFIIIGILTHYDPGRSTQAQRLWIMIWLVSGVTIGPLLEGRLNLRFLDPKDAYKFMFSVISVIGYIIYLPVAIGAFVVMGKMMMVYGSCSVVTELET
ncbi:uncharacterized protein KY384_007840 [Bacidia gigantensis]|uniref:uncharacterized protein n=1 Tax=Bacidia gigantensis TaxID=2732470 RepID=UPI001D0511E0|nr:uncharacterized protein KY384_007840 [Bacidia gigantensis]KAG8527686.1 hypothetical protein KY384_007840 [Bacidia gigantensis]